MGRVLTFQDIMQYYESNITAPSLTPDDSSYIKAMISATLAGNQPSVYNAVYGAQAWYQLNTEANLFGVLPKQTWDKSGFRMITSFTRTPASMAISETGALPTPTAPNISVVKLNPKIVVNTFETTEIVEQLARVTADDIYGNLEVVRQFYATEHVKLLNQQMLALAVGDTVANSVSGTGLLAFESLDRIVSSYAEGTGVGLSATTTPTLASVIDPWSGALVRSSTAPSFDAYVQSASGTFGTGAALSDTLIREVIQGTRTNGAHTNVVVTGYDTYAQIQGLYFSSWRTFNWGEMETKVGLGGINSATGIDAGVRVSTLYGLPLIQAVDTPKEPSETNGISRMYFLDASNPEGYDSTRLGVQVLRPTSYLETTDRDFILLNYIAYEGMYFTIGEQVARFFGANGKLRDIVS